MESNLQNKLQQFSADPPERVWKQIADALDAEEAFSQRLYQYEEPPPAAVWQRLEKNLEIASPAKVISFSTRFRRPLRYAAVACFLAVVLVTITLTVKRTEAGALDADSNTTVPTTQTAGSNPLQEQQDKTVQTSTSTDNTIRDISQTETASKKDSTTFHTEKSSQPIASANSRTSSKIKTTKPVYSSLNGYVFFTDGDGKLRKVSKKLADFVNCKDNDANCKQRLKELRQRMAAKAMTTDFTGILEMLRQLQ